MPPKACWSYIHRDCGGDIAELYPRTAARRCDALLVNRKFEANYLLLPVALTFQSAESDGERFNLDAQNLQVYRLNFLA